MSKDFDFSDLGGEQITDKEDKNLSERFDFSDLGGIEVVEEPTSDKVINKLKNVGIGTSDFLRSQGNAIMMGLGPIVAGVTNAVIPEGIFSSIANKINDPNIEEMLENVPKSRREKERERLEAMQANLQYKQLQEDNEKTSLNKFEEGRKNYLKGQEEVNARNPDVAFAGELSGSLIGVPGVASAMKAIGGASKYALPLAMGTVGGVVNSEDMTSIDALKNAGIGAITAGGVVGGHVLGGKIGRNLVGDKTGIALSSLGAGTGAMTPDAIQYAETGEFDPKEAVKHFALGAVPTASMDTYNHVKSNSDAFKYGLKGMPLDAKDLNLSVQNRLLEPISGEINAEQQRIQIAKEQAGIKATDDADLKTSIRSKILEQKQLARQEAQDLNTQHINELDLKRQELMIAEENAVKNRNQEGLNNYNKAVKEFEIASNRVKELEGINKDISNQIDADKKRAISNEKLHRLDIENELLKKQKEIENIEKARKDQLNSELVELERSLKAERALQEELFKTQSKTLDVELSKDISPKVAEQLENTQKTFNNNYKNLSEKIDSSGHKFEIREPITNLVEEIRANSDNAAAEVVSNQLRNYLSNEPMTLEQYQLLKPKIYSIRDKFANPNGQVPVEIFKAFQNFETNSIKGFENALDLHTKSLPEGDVNKTLGKDLKDLNNKYSSFKELQNEGFELPQKSSEQTSGKYQADSIDHITKQLVNMDPSMYKSSKVRALLENIEDGTAEKVFKRVDEIKQLKQKTLPTEKEYIEANPQYKATLDMLKQNPELANLLEIQEKINNLKYTKAAEATGAVEPVSPEIGEVSKANIERQSLLSKNQAELDQLGKPKSPKEFQLEELNEGNINKEINKLKKPKIKASDLRQDEIVKLQQTLNEYNTAREKSNFKSDIPFTIDDIRNALKVSRKQSAGIKDVTYEGEQAKFDAMKKSVIERYDQKTWDDLVKSAELAGQDDITRAKIKGQDVKSELQPHEAGAAALGSRWNLVKVAEKIATNFPGVKEFTSKGLYEKGLKTRQKLSTPSDISADLTNSSAVELQRVAEIMNNNPQTKPYAEMLNKMKNSNEFTKAATTFSLMQDKNFRKAYKEAKEEKEKIGGGF
jgi:hypothetical protein